MNKDLKVAINTKIKCNKKLSYHLRVNALIVISIIRLLESGNLWALCIFCIQSMCRPEFASPS